jgi:hypothetical protein
LGPFYQRLRARGKPYRVALVAVMRKLLVHLNAVAHTIEAKPDSCSSIDVNGGGRRRIRSPKSIDTRHVACSATSIRSGPEFSQG